MSTDLNRFNWLAPYYDRAARLVFGTAIRESQRQFLSCIPAGSDILILGGGSGELLTTLEKVNPTSHIWYVEASSGMIALAGRRVPEAFMKNVRIIHGTEEAIPAGISFDAIITPFLLDLFTDRTLRGICAMLQKKLRPEGVWLVTDLVSDKWWHRALLRVMYAFFGLTCGIEAQELPSWPSVLQSVGMRERESRMFYRDFIRSSLWVHRHANH